MVVVVILIFFVVMSVGTQDLLWFWPAFDAQPDAIIVRCYGDTLEVDPDSTAFQELVEALSQGLWGLKHWTDLSLSSSTLQRYRYWEDTFVLEFVYNSPIRIHSHYRYFSNVDTLIVPLVGRHAGTYPIFGLKQGSPSAGSLHLMTSDPLLEIVRERGICP
jgi:hypothetical protein